jgi:hypothetical protein
MKNGRWTTRARRSAGYGRAPLSSPTTSAPASAQVRMDPHVFASPFTATAVASWGRKDACFISQLITLVILTRARFVSLMRHPHDNPHVGSRLHVVMWARPSRLNRISTSH